MLIISTTMCYPSPAAPTQGIFVWRRLREIHRLAPVKVVAPEPWFPGAVGGPAMDVRGGTSGDPVSDGASTAEDVGTTDEPPVWRPRMFYLPLVCKSLDARFYARAFEHGLALATRDQETTENHPPTLPSQRRLGHRCFACEATGETPVPPECFEAGSEEPVQCQEGPRDTGPVPRLIDAHFEWPDGVGAWLVARKLGLPFVCTLRGKLVSQIANPLKRRQIRRMLRGADALIAVSQSLAELAREVADRDLNVRVIPNGIDGGVFHRRPSESAGPPHAPSAEARGAWGWSPEVKYVVCVGHLQELKGFHLLVDVWPEVRRRAGDVRLVLVGGGAGEPGYERRLRRQIADLAGADLRSANDDRVPGEPSEDTTMARRVGTVGPPVMLLGRVRPAEVASLLNAADFFVLASRSEGWCNALAEALACGCPVVATDVGGNREIVTTPEAGTLVPPGDREALVEAVCGALRRRWDRERIAAIGGRRNWQQVARKCVDVFDAVLRRRGLTSY